MSEKMPNILIFWFFLLTITGAVVITGDLVNNALAMKYIKRLYTVVFGVMPLLIIIKIISRMLLIGIKGQPISFIKRTFVLNFLLLTKEARNEWREYIEEQNKNSAH